MSHLDQFKTVVMAEGAEAKRIDRGPGGTERLVIATFGGLVTKEIPLGGELDKDIDTVTAAARQIVASANRLTAAPATKLSKAGATASSATPRARA